IGAEPRVQPLDSREVRLGDLHRRDLSGPEERAELRDGEKGQPLVAHRDFQPGPASLGASAGAPSMGRPAAFHELKPVSKLATWGNPISRSTSVASTERPPPAQ